MAVFKGTIFLYIYKKLYIFVMQKDYRITKI